MQNTLDVGCGLNPKGTINTDLYGGAADVISDIHHLPFKTGSFNKVTCHHLLEHKNINYIQATKELMRVASETVVITVPSCLDYGAYDPDHTRIFNRDTFKKLGATKFTRYNLWNFNFPFRQRLVGRRGHTSAKPVRAISPKLRRLRSFLTKIYHRFPYFPSLIPTEIQVTIQVFHRKP